MNFGRLLNKSALKVDFFWDKWLYFVSGFYCKKFLAPGTYSSFSEGSSPSLVAKVEDAPVLAAPHGVVSVLGDLPLLQAEEVRSDSLRRHGQLDAHLGRLIGDEI